MPETLSHLRSQLLPGLRVLTAAAVIAGGVWLVSTRSGWPSFVAVLAFLLGLVIALLLEALRQIADRPQREGPLPVIWRLARDEALFEELRSLATDLLAISRNRDPVYREVVLQRLAEVGAEVGAAAAGTIVFTCTEAWRLAYERLLRSPGLHRYRSVALVEHAGYWQDEPGRQSLRLNFELQDSGRLLIERIVILADELWPDATRFPRSPIREWIQRQHERGIAMQLARRSSLAREPELLADVGIYGTRAVGVQELDDDCRTVRFTLRFDPLEVEKAEELWGRLSVYAVPYSVWIERHFSNGSFERLHGR